MHVSKCSGVWLTGANDLLLLLPLIVRASPHPQLMISRNKEYLAKDLADCQEALSYHTQIIRDVPSQEQNICLPGSTSILLSGCLIKTVEVTATSPKASVLEVIQPVLVQGIVAVDVAYSKDSVRGLLGLLSANIVGCVRSKAQIA